MKSLPSSFFEPTAAAAQGRIAAVRPDEYARTRNHLDGAVTYLSPYITHGFVTLPEVLADVHARHPLRVSDKFVSELGWREFFGHVWTHRGDAILQSIHPGPLPDSAYSSDLPDDLRQARTGVPVIDMAVRTLYTTGTLHNHARLWLASYTIHLRKVHWRTGADWLYRHLLDGHLASNHLSWQWVAGTGSSKPYLFNAENVAKFAPPAWHSGNSVLDLSYEALDLIAHSAEPVTSVVDSSDNGVIEPGSLASPAPAELGSTLFGAPDPATVSGRDVWLVHPWALGEPPADLPDGCLRLGLLLSEFHDEWPWSTARWSFVGARMDELVSHCWYGSRRDVSQALSVARSVHTHDNLHYANLWPEHVSLRPASRLFAEVPRPCASFSKWWSLVTRGVASVDDLPGLQR